MLKMVETFSGIGAQAKALKNAKIDYEILNTADWDINAILAYDYIHNGDYIEPNKYSKMNKEELLQILSMYTLSFDGKKPAKEGQLERQNIEFLKRLCFSIDRSHNLISVTDIKGEDLPNDMNILTYSFPCQDLSLAGCWHGNNGGIDRNANNRSSMLWQIERMLLERKNKNLPMPRFLLMENVRNIMSKKHEANFDEWRKSLKNMGYENYVFELNATNFGIPQKRVRAYMVSVLTDGDQNFKNILDDYYKNNNLENVQSASELGRKMTRISSILKIDYTNPIYKQEADESQPKNTTSRRQIFAENEKLYHNGEYAKIAPTLTTKQDRHPNSGVIDYNNNKKGMSKFRYLTPREGFLLMGFDEKDYEKLMENNFTTSRGSKFFTRDKLNKMAGNSIVVNVLEEIFKQIDYIDKNLFS